jgi:hypothetical protein
LGSSSATAGSTYEWTEVGAQASGAINTWAPASGGNDPVPYSNNVQSWTGLPANTPLNSLSPAQIDSVANAIQRQEGWSPGTITNVPALAGHANGVQ